jgi:hypothetical protein
MTRDQLVRVFPDGRTVHVPSDGRPLAGYALALADLKGQGGTPSSNSLTAARNAGVQVARAKPEGEKSPRFELASLFGFGKDADSKAGITGSLGPAPSRPASLAATANAATTKAPATVVAAVPLPRGRPAPVEVAAAVPAASRPAQQPRYEVMASAEPNTMASLSPWPQQTRDNGGVAGSALAYAAQPGPELNPRPAAIAARPLPAPAAVTTRAAPPLAVSIPPATSVAVKQSGGKPVSSPIAPIQMGQRFDDPWLRAAILAPDMQHFMTVTLMGAPDSRSLREFMQKPASSVAMTFTDGPDRGLTVDRFSGDAVVFVATVSFNARTASLR